MGVVPSSMGDRCFCIGHFRDKRSESEKLSQKTQESFREESQAMFLLKPLISSTKYEDRWMATLLRREIADVTNRIIIDFESKMGVKLPCVGVLPEK